MLFDNGSCSLVIHVNGVVERYGITTKNLTYCQYEILGRTGFTDKSVIEYNVDHCLQLKGKYCNKEKTYKGSVNERLEKFGKGYLDFASRGLYYGDFKFDQMHGEGVSKFNHDEFSSGYMNFDKFYQGIQLYSNLTVVAKQNLSGKVFSIFNFFTIILYFIFPKHLCSERVAWALNFFDLVDYSSLCVFSHIFACFFWLVSYVIVIIDF